MHLTLERWLEELETEVEIVASPEINEEAGANIVTFSLNENLLQEWGQSSVLEFLNRCSELYKKKAAGLAMVCYSWLDEDARQIRICAVSQSHGNLPFKCKLNRVSLGDVVEGIYSSDSGLFTKGVLNVWQQNI